MNNPRIREIIERKKREKAAAEAAAAAQASAPAQATDTAQSTATAQAPTPASAKAAGGPKAILARLAEKRAAAEATAAAEKTTTAAEKTSDVAEKTSAAGEKTSEVADADAATDISIISDGKDTGRKAKPSDDDGVGSSATPLDSATQEGSSITTGDGDKISADDNFAGDKTKQKRELLLQKLKAKKLAAMDSGKGKSLEKSQATSTEAESKSQATSAEGGGSLLADIEKLTIKETVPEKSRGTKGRTVPASANIIRMKIKENMGVFEYNVKFNPIIDSLQEKKAIIRGLTDLTGPTRVFDGATLSLPKLLEKVKYDVKAVTSTGQEVTVTLKVVKRRALKDCEQLFNVIFRRIMEKLKMVEIKRNHYDPSSKMMVPAHKLEIWPGYVIRCQEMDGGLMLMCDTSSKVLRKETAHSLMKDVEKKGGNLKTNLEKALVGQVVMTEYNRANTYRVDEIDLDMNPMDKFKLYTGEEITYVDYYKRTYNIDIKDRQQPMLIHRMRKRAELDVEKTIVLVPELCRMTGLTEAMVSDFRVMKDVAQFTRVGPDQRQKSLQTFIDNVHKSEEAMKLLDEWGLVLAKTPIKLEARVLEAEKLLMGKGAKISVNAKADWGNESTKNPCLVAVELKSWHIVCADRNKNLLPGFKDLCKRLGPKMGIKVAEPSVSVLPNDRTDAYINDLKKHINPNLQLVVCIVPMQREDRYGAIKKLCNCSVPIPSQVICAKTISNEKKVNSCVQKILLQINCKLGGELWGAIIPVKTLMVIGIDVYHDPSRVHNSVMGAVGSLNSTMSAWYSSCKLQRPGQELVDVLTTCVGSLLDEYKKSNGEYPKQVILYRDGVGDGQVETVTLHEVEQIEGYFNVKGISVEFAFILVQKRINRRFFGLDGPGKGFINPPPGSVLDHTVMKKNFDDFLLVSQHVTQGTVTPSHYVVIRNTTSFKWDILQKISYKLTHMYYNWPGTVRVPAPCQYAHKLAYQVGEHTKSEPAPQLMNRLFFL